MLFRRKKPLYLKDRLYSFFIPLHKPMRSMRFYKNKILRIRSTPHKIALGLALGAGVSFTPILGFHTLASFAIAWIFRANIIACLLGTLIGNPLTFPFIFVATYKLGNWILGMHPNPHYTLSMLRDLTLTDFFKSEMSHFLKHVFLPMCVGSVPFSIVTGLFMYFLSKYAIHIYSVQKEHRKMRKKKRKEERKNAKTQMNNAMSKEDHKK